MQAYAFFVFMVAGKKTPDFLQVGRVHILCNSECRQYGQMYLTRQDYCLTVVKVALQPFGYKDLATNPCRAFQTLSALERVVTTLSSLLPAP